MDGIIQTDLTKIIRDANGKGWYVKHGRVQTEYTGTKKINGIRYSIKKGKVKYLSASLATGGSSSVRKVTNRFLRKLPKRMLMRYAEGGGKINLVDELDREINREYGITSFLLGSIH